MTNAEFYLSQEIDKNTLYNKLGQYIDERPKDKACSYITYHKVKNFFESEVQPTLTEDERVKEMVYTNERKREVLATGYYFGLLYYVLSLGTHPTAYVKIPNDNWLCSVENYDDIPINCHGGITYKENYLRITDNEEIEGEFIGWDYAHCNDYAPYYDEVLSEKTHKWTTKEILEEVKEVCSQIVELGKKPHLTEDERVILRNVKWKGYSATHIGRARENKGSYIYIRFENDIEMTYFFDNFFGHLFQFIKERRRI